MSVWWLLALVAQKTLYQEELWSRILKPEWELGERKKATNSGNYKSRGKFAEVCDGRD